MILRILAGIYLINNILKNFQVNKDLNDADNFFNEIEKISRQTGQQTLKEVKNFYSEQIKRIKNKIESNFDQEKFYKIQLIVHTSAIAAAALLNTWKNGELEYYEMSGIQNIQSDMIIKLGELFGRMVYKSTAEASLASDLGNGMAIFGIKFVPNILPISANLATRTLINVVVSFGATELLGWAFVELFYNENDPTHKINVEGITPTTYSRVIHTKSYHDDRREITGNISNITENCTEDTTMTKNNSFSTQDITDGVVGDRDAGGVAAGKDISGTVASDGTISTSINQLPDSPEPENKEVLYNNEMIERVAEFFNID